MALTRRFLSALGIDAEKIDEIITAHTETVEALKEQRDGYKADAEKLVEVTKERDELKAAAESKNDDAYNKLKKEYDDYKAEIAAKEDAAKVRAAYKKLLLEANVSNKRLDSIIKVTDFSGIKLDKDGKLKDVDKLIEGIKSDWADFIVTESAKGADTKTPPENNGGKKSKAEILAIKDDKERQTEIAKNHELFGF